MSKDLDSVCMSRVGDGSSTLEAFASELPLSLTSLLRGAFWPATSGWSGTFCKET